MPVIGTTPDVAKWGADTARASPASPDEPPQATMTATHSTSADARIAPLRLHRVTASR
jgi:hypothetical protein